MQSLQAADISLKSYRYAGLRVYIRKARKTAFVRHFLRLEEKMDQRIQRTKAAIKKAFFNLRAEKPVEKITVTELTKMAAINKATFYLHYSDIYALADEIEDGLIDEVLKDLNVEGNFFDNPKQHANEIFMALVAHRADIDTIFSGGRFATASDKIEKRISVAVFDKSPQYKTNKNELIVSFVIQGIFHCVKTPRVSGDISDNIRILSEIVSGVLDGLEYPER